MRKIGLFRFIITAMCLCVFCALAALPVAGALAEGDMLILTYQEWPEDTPFASFFSGIMPLSMVTPDGYELTPPELTRLTLSYQNGNNWVEITQDNASDLPGQAYYRFEFFYAGIPVSDIIASGGRMIYNGLPAWFIPTGNGALLYENEPVGRIDKIGDTILITFDSQWLEQHSANKLGGSFRVEGSVDWHELPPESDTSQLPNLGIDIAFENDLAKKYGIVNIEKTMPELVADENGNYYLRYTLIVSSLDTAPIPNVTVRDLFDTPDYIATYVDVSEAPTQLPASESGFSPWETRSAAVDAGALSMSVPEMLWEIGTMDAGETRTLTYWAQIAPTYVDQLINNPINNQAKVFSDDLLKADSRASFMPSTDVKMQKSVTSVDVDTSGSGSITYEITVTADENNSFTLENLTLQDAFPTEFSSFLSGDNGQIVVSVNGVPQGPVAYANGAFSFTGFSLAPGETATLTYTVQVNNLFAAANGDIYLTNVASVSKGDRVLRSSSHTEVLKKNSWVSKIVGEQLETDLDIQTTGDVYDYNGGRIAEGTNPGQFTVPAGSVYYQVDLNGDGDWDLSGSTLTDTLGSRYLEYAGYVQVEQIDPATRQVLRTVWLHVDSLKSFSLKVGDLGFTSSFKAYRLRYYARPVDMEEIGAAQVSNTLAMSGSLTGRNGAVIALNGTTVSVDSVIRGSYHYEAEKTAWYYEAKVEPSAAVGTAYYERSSFDGDYVNGAIYWIIRLEGHIPSGEADIDGKNTSLSGFLVQDDTDGQTEYRRDSVLCAFIADKDFDVAATYDDFATLKGSGREMLHGTPLNNKYFSTQNDLLNSEGPYAYSWYSEDKIFNGIIFHEARTLPDNKAIFIILRTRLNSPVPRTPTNYENTLLVDSGAGSVPANTATYYHVSQSSLFKESKGAYIYVPGEPLVNCSNRNLESNRTWKEEELLQKSALPSPGIYAVWLLNVNYNGSMTGDAYVVDTLPEGMEFVFCQVNNVGKNAKPWPQTVYMQELSANPQWQEFEMLGLPNSDYSAYNTITYYNPETRQLRWHVTDLMTNAAGNQSCALNLRIICKVTNHELFLNQSHTYENNAMLVDPVTDGIIETDTADVTITYALDKSVNLPSTFPLQINRLPFQIVLNQYGEDMCEGNTLPTLVDEFSASLLLLEDTIEVRVNDAPYTAFTYTVQTAQNGAQTLLISNLPDEAKITITYQAKINAAPNQPVSISNKAYFAGYAVPSVPQWSESNASFLPGGDLFVENDIIVKIDKVDASSHSKKLDGATFNLYEVNNDTPGDLGAMLRTGTTDSSGEIIFASDTVAGLLHFNRVYCIREETAPLGYRLPAPEDRCHYFIIVSPNGLTPEQVTALQTAYAGYHFDVWYSDPHYSVTLPNDKGVIGVNKVFLDANGDAITPTSGTYRFGLFNASGTLLETIAIEYVAGVPSYSIDGVPTDRPEFTRYEPDMYYHIYELDADGQPIAQNSLVELNGAYYHVSYAADEVISGSGMMDATNQAVSPPNEQRLTISKSAYSADPDAAFTFLITLSAPGRYFYEGSAIAGVEAPASGTIASGETVSLKHGQSVTIMGLPEGTTYTVEEINLAGYLPSSDNPQSGTLMAGDKVVAGMINWQLIDLSLGKTVGGQLGEAEREWTFTIVLNTPDGCPAATTYEVVGASLVDGVEPPTITSISNSGGTVTLSHGQQITIKGLPYGTTYTVAEAQANQDGYTATAKAGDAFRSLTELETTGRELTADETVLFHNHKPAGGVTISKAVSSPLSSDMSVGFLFRITLVDGNGDELPGAYDCHGSATESATPPDCPASLQSGDTVALAHGQQITLSGLPLGVTVVAEEIGPGLDGFSTSVVAAGAQAAISRSATAQVASDNAIIPLDFTNTRLPGSLEIDKTVIGAESDETEAFPFTIRLTGAALRSEAQPGGSGIAWAWDGSANSWTGTIALQHGDHIVIDGIPVGVEYTVTESPNENYTVSVAGDIADNGGKGTIPASGAAMVHFTNTAKAPARPETGTGNLAVSKVVRGDLSDAQRAFDFMLLLSDTSVNGRYGDMTFVSGAAHFTLRHGERKVATGLPAGARYSISELGAGQDGYAVSATGENGVISAGETIAAVFVNTLETPDVPQTGDGAHPALWMLLLLISALGMCRYVRAIRRKRPER